MKWNIVKKREEGFTLIELLATIVIIGVIAVITTPIVTTTLETSRKSGLKTSAEAILKETNLEKAMDKIPNSENGVSITDKKLELKNNPFTNGFIRKNANGKLELYQATNGVYCVNGTTGKLKVVKGNCISNDSTAPTLTLSGGYIGANELTVLASAQDNESGIIGYEYKIGNGSYTSIQSNNFYVFANLSKNTSYTIMVRVTNGSGLKTEKSITLKTKTVSAATF
ncbi:MAG: prepilin-type N-terminal cleavage/methylation domain-containing protein, partial [Firmicutes bacterium]|nr:prepilin-type N-terminal cleavage/methylation domain-containing protein [Bacillota bacterium]